MDPPKHRTSQNSAPDHTTLGQRLHRFVAPMPKPKPPVDPALLKHDQQNKELLDLSRQILDVTKEVRALAGRGDGRNP